MAFAQARLAPDALGKAEAHARQCAACHELLRLALNVPGLAETAVTHRLGPVPAPRATTRSSLAKGTSIGRYTVLELVGRGGMGEVYSAYDPGLDRRVALKLMHAEAGAADPHGQERLLREGQAIAKLSHPNVVVVHDVGALGDQIFVAMEFVEGSTLATWLAERQRSWQEIVEVFVQAGRGLSAAHAAGFVHRDFKPENVMVGRDGAVRVTDFGLARRIDLAGAENRAGRESEPKAQASPSLTRTGELLGTPLYMAPEQFAAGRIDARSDQFSFCVALYWALFGAHPFGGRNRVEVQRNVAARGIATPAKRNGAPASIEKVLGRGLSTDPSERWNSMDDLVAALSSDPVRKRRRWIIAVAASLVSLVVVLSAASVSRRARALCAGGPARLAGVWELGGAGPRSRREAVRAAILRSGTSEPQTTWERVATLLDRHGARWLEAYRETCEATAVRGEQSPEMLDLRMACLNDNLESTQALTQLLSAGERSAIDHAVEASGTLGDLMRCGDLEQLCSGIRPPRDPMIRNVVAELAKSLKRGKVLYQLGQLTQAGAVADLVLTQPASASYCPLRAEALLLKGYSKLYDASRGRETLEKAVLTGESCSDDRVVAEAATALLYSNGSRDSVSAERWAALCDAVLTRMGGDPQIESWLANDLGALRWRQGRFEESRVQNLRAITIKKRLLGSDHLDVGISLLGLAVPLVALERYSEARAALEEALAIVRRWTGEDSVYMASALDNQGDLLLATGQLKEARVAYRRSRQILEAFSPTGVERYIPVIGIGSVALASGELSEAMSCFADALRGFGSDRGEPKDVAEAKFGMAKALDLSHRQPLRARTFARDALEIYSTMPAFARRTREVETWLDQRRPKGHFGAARPM